MPKCVCTAHKEPLKLCACLCSQMLATVALCRRVHGHAIKITHCMSTLTPAHLGLCCREVGKCDGGSSQGLEVGAVLLLAQHSDDSTQALLGGTAQFTCTRSAGHSRCASKLVRNCEHVSARGSKSSCTSPSLVCALVASCA